MHSNDMLPYEVVKSYGAEELNDDELLAVFIRTGTKDENAVAVARRVLKSLPGENLLGLCHVSWKELTKTAGIGEVKAIKLRCLAELAMRISMKYAEKGLKFDRPETIWRYYRESLRHKEREEVIVISLDQKLQLIKSTELSSGTIRECLVSPRGIFLEALNEKAANIILVHNHPSGDPTPSKADLDITSKVWRLGEMMDIPLVDHIIIGDKTYCSLREKGFITGQKACAK